MIEQGSPSLSQAQAAALLTPGGVYRSGQRIGLSTFGNPFLTTAVAADTMYAWPIPVAAPVAISGVALQVGTAVAGVSGKLGLALSGSDGRPGALVAESATIVDLNSVPAAELLATLAGSPVIPAGVAWGLAVFNGAAQPITVGPFSPAAGVLGGYIGQTHIGGFTSQLSGSAVRLSRAHAYASAFPAMLTGWAATVGAAPSSPVMVAVAA